MNATASIKLAKFYISEGQYFGYSGMLDSIILEMEIFARYCLPHIKCFSLELYFAIVSKNRKTIHLTF